MNILFRPNVQYLRRPKIQFIINRNKKFCWWVRIRRRRTNNKGKKKFRMKGGILLLLMKMKILRMKKILKRVPTYNYSLQKYSKMGLTPLNHRTMIKVAKHLTTRIRKIRYRQIPFWWKFLNAKKNKICVNAT